MSRTARSRRSTLVGVAALAAGATLFAFSGCASGGGAPATESPTPTATEEADTLTGDLTIYAAASLKAAFDELAGEFEKAHPDVTIVPIVYDGSSTLATQLVEGAPADVFASADEKNMTTVSDAGLLEGTAQLFATNTLVIATPPDNPGNVQSLADLANPDVSVVLCAPEVPCGNAAHQLLDLDGVAVTPVSEEQNVTAVLTKVTAGEADAGLVYATDAAGAGSSVKAIVPENADQVVNKYPIAALAGAANPDAAAAFVEFILGDEGQAVLERLGFGRP
ncbi:molybdate ABC transporter substrate-binding protein [Agromyces protaetiae]|uniref:Molybdate ABC transporter substrate-binding protein n=1 Tax=Agromyces protaetiae TaxID=2509455 RepID=A0A4P6FEP8_9MICO|nr:molybdate ABC transporter substrate-binding protein [Agromyces protaetiae]QAY74760.1 molybdate ABC transporter substrate-binding protein [Agromyces protaetiae]